MCAKDIYCMHVHTKKNYLSVDKQHLCIDVYNFLKPHKQNIIFYTIYDLLI